MIRLLFIEDDQTMSFFVKSSLEEIIGGYEVILAANGKEGLELLSKTMPDIIVTDLEMPVMDGMEVVNKIREINKHVPVLIATAKKSSNDVVAGYAAGANNYIKKPYLPQELDAHIKGILQHFEAQPQQEKSVYKLGAYRFYPKNYCLEYQSDKKYLTVKEGEILDILCQQTGNVVQRSDIIKEVWDVAKDDYFNSRSLDVFITGLRKLLKDDKSVSINTIKKVGLMLTVK